MAERIRVENKAPVLILGGAANALSLMRSFGRAGITVRACMSPHAALLSRYCDEAFPVPAGSKPEEYFDELLRSGEYPQLKGSVLLVCGDDALEYVARNHDALAGDYLLERNDPKLVLELLDKQRTLEIARDAGVPIPAFWNVARREDVDAALHDHVVYPAILKPHYSHLFQRIYGGKYARVDDAGELRHMGYELIERGIGFMVCEMIPGPDDHNCSFYTYRDEQGRELFHFTKRCVRRYPMNEGSGTYQITDVLPDVEALARQFFDALDFRGFGNLEFKRDERSGELKVIECNTRFTAVQEQLVQSGVESALITYAHITGQPVEPIAGCEPLVAIWSPLTDLRAFRQARNATGLSWGEWRKSMPHKKLVFPYFSSSDPKPFLALLWEDCKYFAGLARNRLGLGGGQKNIRASKA